MPARTGEEYITGLRERAAEVYICGEQVQDVTTHPALRNGVRTIASLYDMQHDPAWRDEMTYISPAIGDRVGLSFITPRTVRDLERRRTMMTHWARATCGMMGRTPDFLNVSLTVAPMRLPSTPTLCTAMHACTGMSHERVPLGASPPADVPGYRGSTPARGKGRYV